MRYPAEIVEPMKKELTDQGFADLTTPDEVNHFVKSKGTTLVVVNSVCGCAAGNARPGARLALEHSEKKPSRAGTVFAGFDVDATNAAREFMIPYPPSSPSMGLFKDGELVYFIPRQNIEGSTAQQVAQMLISAFDEHC